VIYSAEGREVRSLKGLIRKRRKALKRLQGRGERLIKLGDGWFSTKAIVVAALRFRE